MEESKNTEIKSEESQLNKPVLKNEKKLTKPTLISIVLLGILLIAGVGTAAYTQVVLNNPNRIWSDALENTRMGFDEISTILNESPNKGGTFNGTLSLKSPLAATSTLEGSWFEDEAQLSSVTGVSGVTINSDLKLVNNEEDASSDIYIKISGLDSLSAISDLLVPGSKPLLQATNDNWYKLQSSDLEEYVELPDELELDKITNNEYSEEVGNIKSLLDKYFYNTDDKQKVLNYEPVGREDFNGNDSYKYKVTVNEENSQLLLDEINILLENSNFSSFDKQQEAPSSEDVNSLFEEVDVNNVEIEVWVDMDVRYFRNVRLSIPQVDSQMAGYVDVGLDFDGGDVMPFYINIVSENESEEINLLLSASLNLTSKALDLGFDLSAKSNQQPISASGTINITPGDAEVDVEAPEDFDSIDSLIENIGLLGIAIPNSSQDGIDNTPFILDDVEL